MKKLTSTLYILNTLVLSILIYDQTIGINMLVFLLVSAGSLFLLHKPKLTSKIIVAFSLPLLASIGCLLYGNSLSITAFIITYLIFIATLNESRISSIISFVLGGISITSSLIDRLLRPKQTKPATENKKSLDPLLVIGIVIVFLVFLIIYGASNPLFSNILSKINLDFISLRWILFTLTLGYFVFGVFHFLKEKSIIKWDLTRKMTPSQSPLEKKPLFRIDHLILSGLILFSLLNFLLLFVNLTDLYYYVINPGSLKGVTYANALHQSVGTLITSVILAILLILYFFKSDINFIKNNKAIKLLAVLWMVQNFFLILFAAHKNAIYINDYGLTLKRLGVYIYLFLTIVGIAITVFKIIRVKSNWFIISKMTFASFVLISCSSLVNWENFIIKYNISMHKNHGKPLDIHYINSLSENTIPLLYNELDELKKSLTDNEIIHYKDYLSRKIIKFKRDNISDWQSWNVAKQNIYTHQWK